MTEPREALAALREVVDSQVALGHQMTIVPTDVLVTLLARSAPSLDEGLLARAMHAVTILEPGLLSDVDMLNDPFEGDPLPAAKAVAREYRRLAQEGETP